MNKLKPCPFCGGKADLVLSGSAFTASEIEIGANFYVRCSKCKIKGPIFETKVKIHYSGEIIVLENGAVNAVEAWNRRAGDEA